MESLSTKKRFLESQMSIPWNLNPEKTVACGDSAKTYVNFQIEFFNQKLVALVIQPKPMFHEVFLVDFPKVWEITGNNTVGVKKMIHQTPN